MKVTHRATTTTTIFVVKQLIVNSPAHVRLFTNMSSRKSRGRQADSGASATRSFGAVTEGCIVAESILFSEVPEDLQAFTEKVRNRIVSSVEGSLWRFVSFKRDQDFSCYSTQG